MPILSLGILGTFASAALIAVAAHVLFDLSWITSGLLGAALAPTDPAVTFSVLGGREIRGRTGTILKGESGANDPVGIALMIGMIELATSDHGSFWTVVEEFVVEMAGGVAVGVAGAALLLPLMRRVPLPSPALYPLRVVAAAGVIYGAATLVHGSGFLAVFVAGILIGDRPVPHRREIDGVPRLARQPRGDRDVRRARPHDRPDASCSTRTPGSRGSCSRRCSHSRSARSSSARCSSPSGSTGASGCS